MKENHGIRQTPGISSKATLKSAKRVMSMLVIVLFFVLRLVLFLGE